MKQDALKTGQDALIAQLRCGLLREAYLRKVVTEDQYIKLTQQQPGLSYGR